MEKDITNCAGCGQEISIRESKAVAISIANDLSIHVKGVYVCSPGCSDGVAKRFTDGIQAVIEMYQMGDKDSVEIWEVYYKTTRMW